MKVQNMTSSSGNKVANQFLVYADDGIYFQSYDTMIVFQPSGFNGITNPIQLDTNAWNYSVTTGKYRNLFLGEKKAETEQELKKEFQLINP